MSGRQKVALLLPMSGRASAIGTNLERVARLAVTSDDPSVELSVLDTGGEAGGAAAAAANAVGGGAKMVLGPVFGAETQAAANAVDASVPVVAFTNDSSLVGQKAFIFGLIPDQAVSAILGYAKGQGLTRIGVVTRGDPVSDQATASAQRLAAQNGLEITAVVAGSQGGIVEKLRSGSGGDLPDAVLIPYGGEAMIAAGEALDGSGVQLLGTEQWLGSNLASRPAFDEAWFAAPAASASFKSTFAAQQSATPGILAGLVYDAVNMARVLAASGDLGISGVMRERGFNGALGAFRFRADRSCDRSLAILSLQNGTEQVIATSQQS